MNSVSPILDRVIVSRRVLLFVYIVAGAAGLVLAFLLAAYPLPADFRTWVLWFVFALLAALAAYLPFQILERTNFDIATIPTLAGAIVLGPALAAWLAFLAGLVPRRGQKLERVVVVFNACQSALNVAAAGWIFRWLEGPNAGVSTPNFWLAVCAACLVYHLSNILLVSIVVSLQTGMLWGGLVARMLSSNITSDLVIFSMAALTALVAIMFPPGLGLVIVPGALLLRLMTRQYSMQKSLVKANQDLVMAYKETLLGWSRALELRDHETRGHTERVAEMAIELARRMQVPESELENIRRGALLHDIGKIGVPDSILNKPGPLSIEEWAVMRCHPLNAYEVLKPVSYLGPALDIPYCHHEHWDGSGYPRGLKGKAIPLAARIFTIVDVWDALCSERPYRHAWEAGKACQYIQEQSGILFDPAVVAIFDAYLREKGFDR